MRLRSLRSRLAALYAGLAALAVAAVLVAVYVVARHEQIGQLEGQARIAAATLADEVRELRPRQRPQAALLDSGIALERGQLLALVENGRVVAAGATAHQVVAAALRAGLATPPRTATIAVGERKFRVASASVGRDRRVVAAIPFAGTLEASETLLNAVVLAGGIGVLLTALGAWLATRRTLRPLLDIAETARLVAADDLSHRTGAEPLDEIGEVGAAVDRMLHRLEDAFGVQRRFLQDASHELRTPLTIARGHLEVLAAEREPDREEFHETVALVLEELASMGRLVDGLLDLAWASEPRELQLEQLDSEELLERLVSDFQVVAQREWHVEVPSRAPILGDREAVYGIVANLLRNALEHSAEGSAIELTARRVNGGVDVGVRDHGEGVDTAVRDTLFERFVHGPSGGFGLGLAIAQALARRQRGTLRHERPPGGGARFVVHLPSADDARV